MNAEKCLKMLREIKDVSFATGDEHSARPSTTITSIIRTSAAPSSSGRPSDAARAAKAVPGSIFRM